jgi:hypothetical protein
MPVLRALEVVASFMTCIFEAHEGKRVLMAMGICKVDSEKLSALRQIKVTQGSYRLVK